MFLSSSTAARDDGEEWGERFTTLALHARFPVEVFVRTGYLCLGRSWRVSWWVVAGSVLLETTVLCPMTFHLVDVAVGSGTRSV